VYWLLALRPGMRMRTAILGAVALVGSLVLVRVAGAEPWSPWIAGQWFGIGGLVGALIILHVGRFGGRRLGAQAAMM
jgi:hypothetical protein